MGYNPSKQRTALKNSGNYTNNYMENKILIKLMNDCMGK